MDASLPAASGRRHLGDFLRARRALVDPGQHGLASTGSRRVPGLRREEVAHLAGISPEYYVRLEQGRDRHPSLEVLEALARALCLDDHAYAHLLRLAGLDPHSRIGAQPGHQSLRRGLGILMEQWHEQAALLLGPYRDVVAVNALATAVNPAFVAGANTMREVFLDPGARRRYPDWEQVARQGVAALRATVGAADHDPQRERLVADLSQGSPEFERMWAQHLVRSKPSGRQRFRNDAVGVLELAYEPLIVADDPTLTLYVFYAPPGSQAVRQLRTLATR